MVKTTETLIIIAASLRAKEGKGCTGQKTTAILVEAGQQISIGDKISFFLYRIAFVKS